MRRQRGLTIGSTPCCACANPQPSSNAHGRAQARPKNAAAQRTERRMVVIGVLSGSCADIGRPVMRNRRRSAPCRDDDDNDAGSGDDGGIRPVEFRARHSRRPQRRLRHLRLLHRRHRRPGPQLDCLRRPQRSLLPASRARPLEPERPRAEPKKPIRQPTSKVEWSRLSPSMS